jgi:hypothetical protein
LKPGAGHPVSTFDDESTDVLSILGAMAGFKRFCLNPCLIPAVPFLCLAFKNHIAAAP